MATTISISVGPVTASRTFANDVKARDALLAFYTAWSLGPEDAPAQAKLQAVIDWFLTHIRQTAVQTYIDTAKANSRTEAEASYGFE